MKLIEKMTRIMSKGSDHLASKIDRSSLDLKGSSDRCL